MLERWLLLAIMVGVALGPETARAGDSQKQVLVLYSTRRDAQIAVVGERELPRILDHGLSEGVDYYSEFIDQGRFPDPEYQAAFCDFLRLKYKGQRFDIVIAIGDVSVEFFNENRDELFVGTPLVFGANSPPTHRVASSTGVINRLNFSGTLALAAELQPDIRRVFVVTGAAGGDREYEDIARAQFRSFEPRFAITYLSGLTTKELEARLATLPRHSIVYYLLVNQDGAGEKFHPLEYADRVVAVANAPTYSWVDSLMGRGIVGGSLKDQEAQTAAVAQLALRVLHGEDADSIAVSQPDLNVRQVDWRQVRRWGIQEARVPAGTLVKFREPSVWDRYNLYIVTAVALMLGQSILIAGLLVQRARRRQAEARLHASQTDLRTSYDRIRHLGRRLLDAQEDERSRIARELHDDVSQQMAVLAMDLQLLSRCGHPPDAERLASQAIDRADSVAKSLRELSHRLHPANLRLIGLVTALGGLQREFSTADMVVTFTHEDVPATIPHDLALCLFRIAQEALQNAVRHSRAKAVSVGLTRSHDRLVLTIIDDGVGFDVEAVRRGLGLISMGERVEQVGGVWQIRSRPGDGTRLEVSVPVQTAKAAGAAV
jgi:signal transduction histidine kinase